MSLVKYLIVIPARFASTRFPGKMLATIFNKSLIQHTYENAKKSKRIADVLIATDDQKILEHAISFGAEAILTPANCPNGTDRVYHALKSFEKASQDAIIINVQGDEPLLNPEAIDKLCTTLESDSKIQMATLVTPLHNKEELHNPSVVKCVFDKNFNALYFSRSAIPFNRHEGQVYQHVGVYAFRRPFLEIYNQLPESPLQKAEDLEQLKVLEHGYDIKVVVENSQSVGVDTPEDIQKVEQLLCR